MISARCEKTGRTYNGFNAKYNTFNNLPYWFVYETFKESAIRNPTAGFAARFRDALVAFILSRRRVIQNQQYGRY
jgi:hypothetical protein